MPEARAIVIPIRYHTQYGTVPSATTGFKGHPLEEKHLPVLTYEGYKFIGWYYDEAFTQEAKVGDIVGSYSFYLYAKWVEVPTVKSKMTALADEIRELSGTSEAIGLDAMTNYVDEANTDVATEAGLIAQISAALEGKSNGSGNGGIQWISCSTIPTTYVVAPGSQTYYIELPHENCCVLFFDPNNTSGNGCRLGCYDVKARVQT